MGVSNDLAVYQKKLEDQLKHPNWPKEVDRQLETFRLMTAPIMQYGNQILLELLAENERRQVMTLMAQRLGWENGEGPDWLRVYNVLHRKREINGKKVADVMGMRRALSAKSRQRKMDEAGSSILPTSGWLGRYLDYAHDNEAPISYHFFTGLAMFGLAMRKGVVFDRDAFEYNPNNYVFLVGPTAGRKSQAIIMAKILGKKHRQLVQSAQTDLYLKSGTGDRNNPQYDYRSIFLSKECTPQSLVEQMQVKVEKDPETGIYLKNDSIGILMNDEVSNLIGSGVKQSDVMIAKLTDLYGGEDSTRSTLTHGSHVMTNVAFSFVFGSAPSWIKTSITQNMFQGGFLNRSIFVYRQYKGEIIPHASVLDPLALDQLASDLVPWSMINSQIIFRFDETTTAYNWFSDWYRKNHPMVLDKKYDNTKLIAYLARKQDHLCRLAMLLQISDNIQSAGDYERRGIVPIKTEYLEHADAILTFEEQFLPECFSWFGDMDAGDQTEFVWEQIKKLSRSYGTEFARGRLTRHMSNAGRGKKLTLVKEFTPHLDQLMDMGKIETFYPRGDAKRAWLRVLDPQDMVDFNEEEIIDGRND